MLKGSRRSCRRLVPLMSSSAPQRRRPPVPPALRASFAGERVLAVLAVVAVVSLVPGIIGLELLQILGSLIFLALAGGGYWVLRTVNRPARAEYRRRGY